MSKSTKALIQRPAVAEAAARPAALQPRNTRRAATNATANVNNVVQAPGRPLDATTRAFMEPRFGYDLSGVRVHTDAQAGASANALQARAYTAGHNIIFGSGQYRPGTGSGHHLLAHELTHVVQQANGPVAGIPIGKNLSVSHPSDPFERQAGATAERVSSATDGPVPNGGALARLPSMQQTAGHTSLQRDGQSDANAISGAALGVGVLGLTASIIGLVFAGRQANAADRQAEAAENQAVGSASSQGLTVNHTDIPPATHERAPSTSSTAQPEQEKTRSFLKVGIGSDNNAEFQALLRTDNQDILGGNTETVDSSGYIGGSNGNNLFVSFSSHPAPPKDGKATVRVTFNGTNAPPRRASQIQRFSGSVRLNAAGELLDHERPPVQHGGADPTFSSTSGWTIGINLPATPQVPTPTSEAAPTAAPPAAPGGPRPPGTLNDRLDSRFTGRGTG